MLLMPRHADADAAIDITLTASRHDDAMPWQMLMLFRFDIFAYNAATCHCLLRRDITLRYFYCFRR